ncbi:hypothetical protein NE237_020501 [Protea cynaroides]|uniref:Uncharacterized protein n=1 Tax=Protea cynaroides TaxID=273540 RepID=A0A9Q0H630_9MAGN|nr:hypothetical protein NE237_020501 [Protea cynaroides]
MHESYGARRQSPALIFTAGISSMVDEGMDQRANQIRGLDQATKGSAKLSVPDRFVASARAYSQGAAMEFAAATHAMISHVGVDRCRTVVSFQEMWNQMPHVKARSSVRRVVPGRGGIGSVDGHNSL